MRNRAYLLVALLGILTFALAPGIAAAAGQGQNLTELALASDAAARATAVSPAINVSPLSYDFGVVNLGSSGIKTFTISNSGGADLHISNITMPSGSFTYVLGSATVAALGGTTTMDVTYTPTMGINESGVIAIDSDDPHGTFNLNVAGEANAAPSLTLTPAGPTYSAFAFVPFSFDASATDDNDMLDDQVSYSISSTPLGATFDTNTGHFAWTPSPGDAGTYNLTVCANDQYGLSDCQNISITVEAGNSPPIAVAGGPYSSAVGQPVSFDGSASSDPDGNALSFDWAFGDGQNGTGATPTHAYAVANSYLATLTVTDDGTPALSASDAASVTIVNFIPAGIAAKLQGGKLRVRGGSVQQMGMEYTAGPITDIDPATVSMRTTYPDAGSVSSLSADPKTAAVGDLDKDGIFELDVSFPRSAIGMLLGNVPNGTVVTLVMEAHTTTGVPVIGSIDVQIQNTGSGAPVSAFASPNPFNPETAVSFTVQNSGRVSVRIYSIEGRLVKTLKDEFASAGTHEVRWNGMDNNGQQVPSGVYFVKTESAGQSAVFKLSLLK